MAISIREAILEMSRSIKTMLIETFDERYDAITEVATVAATATLAAAMPQGGDSLIF